MVQIIPQDVGLAARIAQGVLPPLGEGFQQQAERGIEREQGLKQYQQQTDIGRESALEQERLQRQMNLNALEDSGLAEKFPGLYQTLKFQIGAGLVPDTSVISNLQARLAERDFWKRPDRRDGAGTGTDTQPQPQPGGAPGQPGLGSGVGVPYQPGIGSGAEPSAQYTSPTTGDTQVYSTPQNAPPAAEAVLRMQQTSPISYQNEVGAANAIGRPGRGEYSTEWDQIGQEQRQEIETYSPELAQRMRTASENEKRKIAIDREIDEQEYDQLHKNLTPFYQKSNLADADGNLDPEYETFAKALYRNTRGMSTPEAEEYVKNNIRDIARDQDQMTKMFDRPDFNFLEPSEKDMNILEAWGSKFQNLGLGEEFKDKLRQNFTTDYPIEAIMNPLDKEYKSRMAELKGPERLSQNLRFSSALGGSLVANYLENHFSTRDTEAEQKSFDGLVDTLIEAIPKGQSLYAFRQEAVRNGIPPSWVEQAVTKAIERGNVKLNSRQLQEYQNVGQTSAEHINNTKIQPWFRNLKGTMRNVASALFG